MFGSIGKARHIGQLSVLVWKRHYLKMSQIFPPLNFKVQKGRKQEGNVQKSSFQLMLQSNLLQVASTGSYYLHPLLTRSLEKLCRLVDEEMQAISAQKVIMPCVAPAALWEMTNRWEEMGSELFRFMDRRGINYCLAPTHEEAMTTLVKNLQPVSYKQLPIKLYQIGRKFRDEMRPKNGLVRCREFDMKDLYTFDQNEDCAKSTYSKVIGAYRKLFDRLGIRYYQVEASTGAMGGDSSHEFHIVASRGEDTLVQCEECEQVYNEELMQQQNFQCRYCQSTKCRTHSGIEIAHCFILGTKYSVALNAMYHNKDNKDMPYYMGCYGIGITRLLAAVLEDLDSDNLRWPRLMAPYQVVVMPMQKGYKSEESYDMAEKVSKRLSSMNNLKHEVILDDRINMSIGKRLSAAKQVGIPYAVVIGRKALDSEGLLEFKDVYSDKTEFYTQEEVVQQLSAVETV